MSYTFKPVIPSGKAFNGEIVYNSTEIEVPDNFRCYVENFTVLIEDQYENKYTGFETKKYNKNNGEKINMSVILVGSLPHWLCDLLKNLAIAMNGSGMVLEFKDTWITGTDSSIKTYNCRWINAGDFVDNSELLCGATMELITL